MIVAKVGPPMNMEELQWWTADHLVAMPQRPRVSQWATTNLYCDASNIHNYKMATFLL